MIKVWLRPKPDTYKQHNKMLVWCLEHNLHGHPAEVEDVGYPDTDHPGSWYLKEEDASAFHLTFELLYYENY